MFTSEVYFYSKHRTDRLSTHVIIVSDYNINAVSVRIYSDYTCISTDMQYQKTNKQPDTQTLITMLLLKRTEKEQNKRRK